MADFQKNFEHFDFGFLGRPKKQNFEKMGVFWAFLENLTHKLRFFGARSPFKLSIYRQK